MKSFDTTWEEIHELQEWGQYPTEHVIRFIARNYYKSDRKSVSVLDFGCGAGAHTWYLVREGFDTYAFDGSKSAISRLEKRLKRENLSADLRVMDALELNYQNDFFDAIIDNVCIYGNTLENIEMMYKKTYSLLRKGGKLLTSSFSKNTTGYGTGEKIEEETYCNLTVGNIQGRGTIHFWDKQDLISVLERVGYINVTVDILRYTDRGNVVEMFIVQAEKN